MSGELRKGCAERDWICCAIITRFGESCAKDAQKENGEHAAHPGRERLAFPPRADRVDSSYCPSLGWEN